MQDQQEPVFPAGLLLDVDHADQGSHRQIEGLASLATSCLKPGSILDDEFLDLELRVRIDDLYNPFSARSKGRSEDAMSRHHLVEAVLQSGQIQRTREAKDADEVVGGRARIHLMREPQAPLHLTQEWRLILRSCRKRRPAPPRRRQLQPDRPLQPGSAVVFWVGAHGRNLIATRGSELELY